MPPVSSRPAQLSLFEHVASRDHTNSFALYDIMPKWTANAPTTRRNHVSETYKYRPILRRVFIYDKIEGTLTITPARLDNNGISVDYYPGAREELVEAALRKIAIAQRRTTLFEGPAVGVRFTLSHLRRELRRESKDRYSLRQVHQALQIMHHCNICLTYDDKTISAPILPVIAIRQAQSDGECETYATFHPLVTRGILDTQWRQINHCTLLLIDDCLARWLFKRLVHKFTQASLFGDPYNISATRIIRDSGVSYTRQRDALAAIHAAFERLKQARVISKVQINRMTGQRGKIEDEIYKIFPTTEFVREQKCANALAREVREGRGPSRR